MVEVADVDAEFERARGHDDAVFSLGEGALRRVPLAGAQARVGHVRFTPASRSALAERLDATPAVHEDQALLSRVQRRR